jgi:hypothetical protein
MISIPTARFLPAAALTTMLLASCPAAVHAGDLAPADVAARRPVRRSHLQPVADVATREATSGDLGMRLTRASAVLRQQLALDRGAGLVVDSVTTGSRADRAGIRQHDVLVMLDDQLLILPDQLSALVEAAPPETPLQCTVLRGGRRITIPFAGPHANAGTTAPRSPAAAPGLRPTAPALAIAGQRPGNETAAAPHGLAPGRVVRMSHETLLRHDADYQIRLSGGDETRLVVTDTQGRVVFNDTIDTPEHRSRMPVAVRGRVEEMERTLERQSVTVGRLETAPIEIR